jgi:hypothetical protein
MSRHAHVLRCFLRPSGAGAFIHHRVHGLRCAPPVATSLRPSRAEKKIAAEVSRHRDAARHLREEARGGWDAAKRRFEEALLGPEPKAHGSESRAAKGRR